MLIKPTSVPEVGTVEPTDTESVAGVTPLVGLTTSQLLLEKACTVKFTAPVEFVICSGCAGANAPLKTSCGGYAVSVALCARAVSMEHTRTASRATGANKNLCVVFTVFSKRSRKLWLEMGRGNRRLCNHPATKYRPPAVVGGFIDLTSFPKLCAMKHVK